MIIQNNRPLWVNYLYIIFGTALMGIAIQSIYDPLGLVVGGFTGAAIVVKSVTAGIIPGGIPLWLTNLALNIPVFLIGYKVKGKRFIGRTAVATFLLSFWLYVLPHWDIPQGDYLIATIYGGLLTGIGVGFVLLAKATTGGTDMVGALIQQKLRHYTVVQIMVVLDGIIIILGLAVFGIKPALYAVVAIFITSQVSDALMEGFKYSKAVYIITDRASEVADALMHELGRGVTGLAATGMYSGEARNMLYCVVSKKEIVELKDIVKRLDKSAFVIVTDAREVLGEGFLEY